MLPPPSPKHPSHVEYSDRNTHMTWLQEEQSMLLLLIFLTLPIVRRREFSCSPEPLTGQASGMVPRPQQRPGSQQHCIFVILPGSSCAQRPFTRPEKHVPVLWSEHGETKQKMWQNYFRSLPSLVYILEEAKQRKFYLTSIIPICSLNFCDTCLFPYLFTEPTLIDLLCHIPGI